MAADLTADALRAAPMELQQHDATWTLEAEGWRSFQPITTARGDPLIVVTRVMSSAPLNAGVRIESVALARGAEVWSGPATEEVPRAPAATVVEAVTRNGPPWAAGDSVDLVARIADGSGAIVMLRARTFAIARVH
jgi:hypothetical protein